MYAAVRRVIREQERWERERLGLELERERLEKALKLHYQHQQASSAQTSEEISEGDPAIPLVIPSSVRRDRRLQRHQSFPSSPEYGSIDIGILTTFRQKENKVRPVKRPAMTVSIEEPPESSTYPPIPKPPTPPVSG